MYPPGTSVKLVVYAVNGKNSKRLEHVSFTCDVSSHVEHVVLKAACDLEDDINGGGNEESGGFALQVGKMRRREERERESGE